MIKRKKELVEYARRLKLASLAEHMTEIIHEAQEKQPTYSEFLFSCLAKDVGERDRKSFLSRIKVAGLPARHTLDEYDFNRTEGLDGRQLRELRELTWMSRAYNLLLVGGPGTGKTFIASGLDHEAVKEGYNAALISLEALLVCLKTKDVSRHAMKT